MVERATPKSKTGAAAAVPSGSLAPEPGRAAVREAKS